MWDTSARVLEEALALRSHDRDVRFNFALALIKGRHYEDAVAELRRILRARPDDVQAHLAAGQLHAERLGNPGWARIHFRKVLSLQPRHPQAQTLRYWLDAVSRL